MELSSSLQVPGPDIPDMYPVFPKYK